MIGSKAMITKKVQDFVVSNIVVKGEVWWFPEDLFLIVVVAVTFAFTVIAVTGIDRLLFYHYEQLFLDATDRKGGFLCPTCLLFMQLMMVDVCTRTRAARVGGDDCLAAMSHTWFVSYTEDNTWVGFSMIATVGSGCVVSTDVQVGFFGEQVGVLDDTFVDVVIFEGPDHIPACHVAVSVR
jgi:hypothetical protein